MSYSLPYPESEDPHSFLDSSANWLKELMLALVYNIINQLWRAIIHLVTATTCNSEVDWVKE